MPDAAVAVAERARIVETVALAQLLRIFQLARTHLMLSFYFRSLFSLSNFHSVFSQKFKIS